MYYYTYNGFIPITTALELIGKVFTSTYYKESAGVIVGICLFIVFIRIINSSLAQGKWILTDIYKTLIGIILFNGAILITQDITVQDKVTNQVKRIQGIPILMSLMLEITNEFEVKLINLVDSTSIEGRTYGKGAGGIGFSLISDMASNRHDLNSRMNTNLTAYINNCVLIELVRTNPKITIEDLKFGTKSMKEILEKSADEFPTTEYIKSDGSRIRQSCKDIWKDQLSSDIQDGKLQETQNANCKKHGITDSIVCNSMIEGHLKLIYENDPNITTSTYRYNVAVTKSIANSLAEGNVDDSFKKISSQQMLQSGIGAFLSSSTFTPYMKAAFLGVCISISPFLLLFLPTFKIFDAFNMVFGFFLLNTVWTLTDVLLHHVSLDMVKNSFETIKLSGYKFTGITNTQEVAQNAIATIGQIRSMSMALASMIMFGLFKTFGGNATGVIAGGMQQNIQSAAQKATTQLSPENYVKSVASWNQTSGTQQAIAQNGGLPRYAIGSQRQGQGDVGTTLGQSADQFQTELDKKQQSNAQVNALRTDMQHVAKSFDLTETQAYEKMMQKSPEFMSKIKELDYFKSLSPEKQDNFTNTKLLQSASQAAQNEAFGDNLQQQLTAKQHISTMEGMSQKEQAQYWSNLSEEKQQEIANLKGAKDIAALEGERNAGQTPRTIAQQSENQTRINLGRTQEQTKLQNQNQNALETQGQLAALEADRLRKVMQNLNLTPEQLDVIKQAGVESQIFSEEALSLFTSSQREQIRDLERAEQLTKSERPTELLKMLNEKRSENNKFSLNDMMKRVSFSGNSVSFVDDGTNTGINQALRDVFQHKFDPNQKTSVSADFNADTGDISNIESDAGTSIKTDNTNKELSGSSQDVTTGRNIKATRLSEDQYVNDGTDAKDRNYLNQFRRGVAQGITNNSLVGQNLTESQASTISQNLSHVDYTNGFGLGGGVLKTLLGGQGKKGGQESFFGSTIFNKIQGLIPKAEKLYSNANSTDLKSQLDVVTAIGEMLQKEVYDATKGSTEDKLKASYQALELYRESLDSTAKDLLGKRSDASEKPPGVINFDNLLSSDEQNIYKDKLQNFSENINPSVAQNMLDFYKDNPQAFNELPEESQVKLLALNNLSREEFEDLTTQAHLTKSIEKTTNSNEFNVTDQGTRVFQTDLTQFKSNNVEQLKKKTSTEEKNSSWDDDFLNAD